MRLPLIALAVATLAGCSSSGSAPPVWIDTAKPGAELAFMRAEAGWKLSLSPPRFPYNIGVGPELEGLSGAGSPSAFGCGLTSLTSNYFSGRRGRLACLIGQADGRLLQATIGSSTVSRVHDATPIQGDRQVIAQFVGTAGPSILTLSPDGTVTNAVVLDRRWRPDQAVILRTGRIALSQRTEGRCTWYVLERRGATYSVVSETPADASNQCHASGSGGGILRDQVNGELYAHFGYPSENTLYKIDDNGARGPLQILTPDLAAGAPSGAGDASLMIAHDGTIYFGLTTPAGPVLGRHTVTSGRTTFTDLTASTGRWQDTARLTGFIIGDDPAAAPLAALMNLQTGETALRAFDDSN
ncbi:hypothetical protein [Brevundimonas sp.]